MARRGIPDPLKRRHLLEGALDPTRALAIAEAYLEEGRRQEALDFLRKADARERIQALRAEAREEGNVFLLRSCANALGEEPGAEEWEELERHAQEAGRSVDANEAARQVARLRV